MERKAEPDVRVPRGFLVGQLQVAGHFPPTVGERLPPDGHLCVSQPAPLCKDTM